MSPRGALKKEPKTAALHENELSKRLHHDLDLEGKEEKEGPVKQTGTKQRAQDQKALDVRCWRSKITHNLKK